MRFRTLLAVYGTLALIITWPVVLDPTAMVPGAERTDLWDNIWSLWFFRQTLVQGHPFDAAGLLNHPLGGHLFVADMVNAVMALPLIPVLGLPASYALLVICQLVFSGIAAHRLAEAMGAEGKAAFIAGVGFEAAPVLISAVHNGTSECIGGGWLALALLTALHAVRKGGLWRILGASTTLGVCTMASWYYGVCAYLALGSFLLVGEGLQRTRLLRLLPILMLGLLVALPVALLAHDSATRPDNLVGIKDLHELTLVRRTTGPADPLGWFMPGDFRSPDFRVISRYNEAFIHCHYLGWLLIVGSILAALRGEARGLCWLYLGGFMSAILAMGPVLARFGEPLIFLDGRALPLPYLLLERLPGFRDLSIVFRLAALSSLAVSVGAAVGWGSVGRKGSRWRALAPLGLAVAVFLELRLASPVRGLPDQADATAQIPILALRDAPAGAVMNFPVAGGRRFLYEQTFHGKPLTAQLNFPNNRASQKVWKAILGVAEQAVSNPDAFRDTVRSAACPQQVRYLVVHVDPMARPDMHDTAIQAIKAAFVPFSAESDLRVYDLCAAEPDSR